MELDDDIAVRLSAQRALLGHVTPQLRAVSVELDNVCRRLTVRFVFAAEPSESGRDAASCAGAEMIADRPDGWTIDEQIVVCEPPAQAVHLRHLVYTRSEDTWVRPLA
jgi:hypothetical protein